MWCDQVLNRLQNWVILRKQDSVDDHRVVAFLWLPKQWSTLLSLSLSATTPIWDLIRIECNGKSNLRACGICCCRPPDMALVVSGNAISATRGHA